jgi:peroxiredoxin
MPLGLVVRRGRSIFAVAAVLAVALGPAGCANKEEPPKQEAPSGTESTPNVTIDSYQKAPDAELKGLDGTVMRLADYQGDIVILTFMATWNKECVKQVAELNELQAKLQRYRFAIIGVFTDKEGREKVAAFIEKNPARFSVVYNGEDVVAAFGGARRLPTTYILLRDGSIFTKEVGFRTMQDLERFTQRINAMRL